MEMKQLFLDYLSGEVFENLELSGVDIYGDNFQQLDLMTQLYEHSDFKQAEKIAKDLDLYIDLDFYWGDIFARVETDDNEIQDLIQDLVAFAYETVMSEEFFNSLLGKLDTEVTKALSKIY